MYRLLLALTLCFAAACGSDPAASEPADTGVSDTEADGATDADTDADTDVRVDAETDAVTDAGPADVDADPDTTSDADVEPDGEDVELADVDGGTCRDGDDPRIQYLSTGETGCDSGCPLGWTAFDDACGCGCEADPTICPDPDQEGVTYAATSPAGCADIDFACAEGEAAFSLSCGCGCVSAPDICLDPADPDVSYVSTSPEDCWLIDYSCDEGSTGFQNVCGCGCVAEDDNACPDAEDPFVQYVFEGDPESCAASFFACEEGGEVFFEGECGCGCLYDDAACPDPADRSVSYLGDPDECERIDFDCVGGEAFDGPCGCGCIEPERVCPDVSDPTIWYAARTLDECSRIRFACPETWSGLSLPGGCPGCGCQAPDRLDCDPEKFIGTSGLAEPFGLYASCEFLIACSDDVLSAGLEAAFRAEWGREARCGDGSTLGCPSGTASFCQAFVGEVDAQEIASGCAVSTSTAVDQLLCGGDL